MSLISIKVNNWDAHNPRSDRGNFSWFKFQNNFFSDQKIFGLSSNSKLLFVFLCCEASRTNNSDFDLDPDYVAAILRISEKQLRDNINDLSSRGLVKVLKDSSRVSDEIALVSYIRGEDIILNKIRGEESTLANANQPNSKTIDLLQLWNIHSSALPKARGFSEKRKRLASKLLTSEPREAYWVEVIKRMAASEFCNGSTGWVASFDFLLKPDTHLKVLEGAYDNRDIKTKPTLWDNNLAVGKRVLEKLNAGSKSESSIRISTDSFKLQPSSNGGDASQLPTGFTQLQSAADSGSSGEEQKESQIFPDGEGSDRANAEGGDEGYNF